MKNICFNDLVAINIAWELTTELFVHVDKVLFKMEVGELKTYYGDYIVVGLNGEHVALREEC